LDKQIGSVYGLAYQKSTNRLFASAYLKRHVGLGSGGLDAIYVTTPGSNTPQLFVNLKADLGIDVGTIGSNTDRQLGSAADPNYDIEGYNQAGKIGIGDIDISQDDQTLYLTNLYDKKLYAIKIDTDHNPATKPTPADVTSYVIPDPGCNTPEVTSMHINMQSKIITGDKNNRVWTPDAYHIGGSPKLIEYAEIDTSASEAAPEEVYLHPLESMQSFQIPVSNGVYTVKLHYADTSGSSGDYGRIFNVSIEGGSAGEGSFNIYNEAGNAKALVKTYTATVNDHLLDIAFSSVNQEPIISAIEVIGQTPVGAGEWRPFALGIKNDAVFVGGVCDASGSQNPASLKAVVYKVTPRVNADFIQVLNTTLDYNKGFAYQSCLGHRGWFGWLPDNTYPPECDSNNSVNVYPQPMLVDISFANDDSMILGLRDRFGDQSGMNNYALSGNHRIDGIAAGDVLRAAYSNGTYALENNAKVGSLVSAGAGNNQGPGGGEFYYEDSLYEGHYETGMGALATYLPLNQTLYTRMDVDDIWQGGLAWLNNDTGAQAKYYVIYGKSINDDSSFLGKASGLGDIEMATPPSPTEIGNRVWLDTNQNGIQDADEAGLDNVTVTLDCGTGQTASTTTANGGNYLFSNASGGNATFMQPPMNCTVKIDPSQIALNTYQLTTQNADSHTDNDALTDLRDSDAALVSGQASITVNLAYAGANNHSLDFGFTEATKIDLHLSKLVSTPQALPNAPAHVLVPGDMLTYTLILTNEGANPATTIQVKDLLPSRLQYLEHNGDGQYDKQTGLWSIASLAAGASATLTIKANIN
jgi:uncharacterized repeat protein (TIGR01451 family)